MEGASARREQRHMVLRSSLWRLALGVRRWSHENAQRRVYETRDTIDELIGRDVFPVLLSNDILALFGKGESVGRGSSIGPDVVILHLLQVFCKLMRVCNRAYAGLEQVIGPTLVREVFAFAPILQVDTHIGNGSGHSNALPSKDESRGVAGSIADKLGDVKCMRVPQTIHGGTFDPP